MRTPILLYHWFDDPATRSERSPEFGIRADDFRRQMDWLSRSSTVVSLADVVRAVRGETQLPRRAVAITFDDAYQDFREHALPVLQEYGFPATVFVVSGLIGQTNEWDQATGEPARDLLDWAGLRELVAGGVEIGAHSVTHPDMRRISDEALARECADSKKCLEDGLGQPVRHFAYPFGRYHERARQAVREAGYDAGFAVLLRLTDLLRSDQLSLMRVIVHANKGLASFRLRAQLAAPFHRVA